MRVARVLGLFFILLAIGCDSAPSATARKKSPSRSAVRRTAQRPASRAPAAKPVPAAPQAANNVVLHTSAGDITLRLFPDRAPRTVAQFLKYVESGHYNGTIFHQVVDSCLILGGAFTPELQEKPAGAPVPNEAATCRLSNSRGTIAMARPLESIDSAGSQFFINLVDNPQLDHVDNTPEGFGYCVFGEVTSGLDVVDQLGSAEVRSIADFEMMPVRAVMIQSAQVLR